MKKIIKPGLLAGLVMVVFLAVMTAVLNRLFPSLLAEYRNAEMYRAWDEPLLQVFFLAQFPAALFMAYIWNKAKKIFPATEKEAIWNFGWFCTIGLIPGLLMIYGTCAISLLMLFSWLVLVFGQCMLGSLIIVKMMK